MCGLAPYGVRRSMPVPPPPARVGPRPPTGGWPWEFPRKGRPRGRDELVLFFVALLRRSARRGSALALLVARVVTNDHDPAVPADDAALVADLLNARLDLHGS